jgi:hypothetical protein
MIELIAAVGVEDKASQIMDLGCEWTLVLSFKLWPFYPREILWRLAEYQKQFGRFGKREILPLPVCEPQVRGKGKVVTVLH